MKHLNKPNTAFNLHPRDFTYALNDKAHLTGTPQGGVHKTTHNAHLISLYVVSYKVLSQMLICGIVAKFFIPQFTDLHKAFAHCKFQSSFDEEN